jgi:hypothetical protein
VPAAGTLPSFEHAGSPVVTRKVDRRLSVAPMMGWTDDHKIVF